MAPNEPDGIYCRECGAPIATGYSWKGYCAECAEFHQRKVELLDLLEKAEVTLRMAIGFFSSGMRSGEPWTKECDDVQQAAISVLASLKEKTNV